MKSTLERIDDLEKKINELQAMNPLATAKLEQETGQLRVDINKCVSALQDLNNRAQKAFEQFGQMLQGTSHQIVSMEQSLISFSKSLAAIAGELISTGALNNDNVVRRVRQMDEAGIQAEVNEKIRSGILKPSETISDLSTVVVSEDRVSPDGTAKKLSDYNAIDIAAGVLNPEEKAEFIGKKAGDLISIKLHQSEDKIAITVKEVYEMVLGTREGEVPQAQEETGVEAQLDSVPVTQPTPEQ
jgi:hypothetical protein